MIIFTHRNHKGKSEQQGRAALMRPEGCFSFWARLGSCFERAKQLSYRNILGEKIPPGPAIIKLSWRTWEKAARVLPEGAGADPSSSSQCCRLVEKYTPLVRVPPGMLLARARGWAGEKCNGIPTPAGWLEGSGEGRQCSGTLGRLCFLLLGPHPPTELVLPRANRGSQRQGSQCIKGD